MDASTLSSRLSSIKSPIRAPSTQASPLASAHNLVTRQLRQEEGYRIAILRTVKTLACLSDDELRYAAHSMTERHYEQGEHIITQDEKGDTFFLLERGTVSVRRKANMRDKAEAPVEIARLHDDAYFGEISLMLEEARSASVVCLSETCKCLLMTKRTFDEIRQSSHKASAAMRSSIARQVLNSCKIFEAMSKGKKEKMLQCMKAVSYPAGAYITRQVTICYYVPS